MGAMSKWLKRVGKSAINSFLQYFWVVVFAWIAAMTATIFSPASESWEAAFVVVGSLGTLTAIVMLLSVAKFVRGRRARRALKERSEAEAARRLLTSLQKINQVLDKAITPPRAQSNSQAS